jgi:hypothetical protein
MFDRGKMPCASAASDGTDNAELRHVLRTLFESLANDLILFDEFTKMKSDYEAKIVSLSYSADAIRDEKLCVRLQEV